MPKEWIRMPSIHEVVEYIRKKVYPDYPQVLNEYREVKRKEWEMRINFEKWEKQMRNRISELEQVGITAVPLTEEERKAWSSSVWESWLSSGGDPFDKPSGPPPKYWLKVTDPEARKEADKEIKQIEEEITKKKEQLKQDIKELWKEFDDKYGDYIFNCGLLIEQFYDHLYDLTRDYYGEGHDLLWLHPIEALARVFVDYEELLEKEKKKQEQKE